jgi:hypothetical protein
LVYFLGMTIAFGAGRLFYGWVEKADLQSPGFSPSLASLLTAPIVAFACYVLAFIVFGMIDFVNNPIREGLLHSAIFLLIVVAFLILVAPIIPFSSALLAIYLRGGLRKRVRILWGAAASLLVLEFLWLVSFPFRLE